MRREQAARKAVRAYIYCYHAGMAKHAEFVQYTIRGVPREIDRMLRKKAAQRKQSLNQVVLDELAASAMGRRVRADFSDVAGGWVPDPAFEEAIAAQRQIDPEQWK